VFVCVCLKARVTEWTKSVQVCVCVSTNNITFNLFPRLFAARSICAGVREEREREREREIAMPVPNLSGMDMADLKAAVSEHVVYGLVPPETTMGDDPAYMSASTLYDAIKYNFDGVGKHVKEMCFQLRPRQINAYVIASAGGVKTDSNGDTKKVKLRRIVKAIAGDLAHEHYPDKNGYLYVFVPYERDISFQPYERLLRELREAEITFAWMQLNSPQEDEFQTQITAAVPGTVEQLEEKLLETEQKQNMEWFENGGLIPQVNELDQRLAKLENGGLFAQVNKLDQRLANLENDLLQANLEDDDLLNA